MQLEPIEARPAVGAQLPPALLQYAVTPSSVNYSGGPDALSIVTLVISATNPTSAALTCSSLTFTVPCGAGQDALTADPSTITVTPGSQTPWAIWGGGDGSWRAVPLPPATSIGAGATINFVLANVVVNELQSPSVVFAIQEETDTLRAGTATLAKSGAAPPGKLVPTIASFTALPSQVALGGTVTLAWTVTDALSCAIEPGPISVPNPASGTLPLPLSKTTLFTLRALGSGGTASANASAAVMPVAIESFTASPATVAPGGSVTLSWQTAFAASCSVDQGVGPMPTSGSTTVQPQWPTTYTLTAQGLNPLTRAVNVDVKAT